MSPDEKERIRQAAIVNGRRERREQGIPEKIEAEGMTARLAALLAQEASGRLWLSRLSGPDLRKH